MKRWRWHILLFVAVYGVSLVSTLPAVLALRWAEPALVKLPERPVLQGVEGTLWSGHASQVVFRGVSLGEVQWHVSPWPLLIGHVNVAVKLNNADGYLDAVLSTGFSAEKWFLRQAQGQVPASLVKGFAPALPIAPTGTFALAINEARFDNMHLRSLDGRIVWNKGGIASPLPLEFGDLVAEFDNSASGISGHIKDNGGPLQLNADVKLSSDGVYILTGKSAARAGAAPSLVTSLSLLGQPDAQGMVPIHISGRI